VNREETPGELILTVDFRPGAPWLSGVGLDTGGQPFRYSNRTVVEGSADGVSWREVGRGWVHTLTMLKYPPDKSALVRLRIDVKQQDETNWDGLVFRRALALPPVDDRKPRKQIVSFASERTREGSTRYVFTLDTPPSDFTGLYVRTQPALWDGTAEVLVPTKESTATPWKSVGKTSINAAAETKNARWDPDHDGQHHITGIPSGARTFALELRTAGTAQPALTTATLETTSPQIVFRRPGDARLRLVYGAPGITKAMPSRETEIASVYYSAGPRPLQIAELAREDSASGGTRWGGSWMSGPLPKWVAPAAVCIVGALLFAPAIYYLLRGRRNG
jgi:hypothetical protein